MRTFLASGPRMPLTRLATLGTLSPFHGERERAALAGCSSPINLLIQIPQNPRRHAPDIALPERHLVIVARDALPVAALARVVGGIHHEGERHLEGVGDF